MHGDRPSVVSFGPATRRPAPSRMAAVVGGAGFIGSHLCEALLECGRDVVCIDNFQRGSVHNLAALIGEPRGQVVCHDVSRGIPGHLPRFDEIYHLVPLPGSPAEPGARRGRRCARVALGVLDRAARDGARVLLATPAREGRDLRSPDHGTGEAVFGRCAAKRGVNLRVARIFDSYGPRMHLDSGCEVSSYVMAALRGEPLRIDDAAGRRRLCFVDDVVQGCIRLMDAEAAERSTVAEPTEVTLAVLARTILELAEARDRAGPPAAGCSRAGTGAGAARPLREGLELTIADFAARFGVRPATLARQRFG